MAASLKKGCIDTLLAAAEYFCMCAVLYARQQPFTYQIRLKALPWLHASWKYSSVMLTEHVAMLQWTGNMWTRHIKFRRYWDKPEIVTRKTGNVCARGKPIEICTGRGSHAP